VLINIELRFDVEDSPNSAEVVIDAVRRCKIALYRSIEGPIDSLSTYFFKHLLSNIQTTKFAQSSWITSTSHVIVNRGCRTGPLGTPFGGGGVRVKCLPPGEIFAEAGFQLSCI
jgi:hypothetical protein